MHEGGSGLLGLGAYTCW